MGKCDKSLKHPVLHRAFLPGVSLQHSAPVFQLKYAPYSLLSREYYTCFPAKVQGEIWDLFCLGHFFGVGVAFLPSISLETKKRAAFSGHSLMESMVFYSYFAANFSAISSRCSKVCFSSGYQDHFFAGYDFFRAIVYDTIPVDNHRQTGSC